MPSSNVRAVPFFVGCYNFLLVSQTLFLVLLQTSLIGRPLFQQLLLVDPPMALYFPVTSRA